MALQMQIVQQIVAQALAEDIGPGDVTAQCLFGETFPALGRIVSRQEGVAAGLPVAEAVFAGIDAKTRFKACVADGDRIGPDTVMAEIEGPAAAILSGERVALNFLQRLCGIATATRRCVDAVGGRPVRILDTRKTTPLLRRLEKYAVSMGGGHNHRMGLYDQALIKDNHLALLAKEAGGLCQAVRIAVGRCRQAYGSRLIIEVEVTSHEMLQAALESDADIVLLDNMSAKEMTRACDLVRQHRQAKGSKKPLIEASGGITLKNLPEVAATGVDMISLGALTHSAPALDISLDVLPAQ